MFRFLKSINSILIPHTPFLLSGFGHTNCVQMLCSAFLLPHISSKSWKSLPCVFALFCIDLIFPLTDCLLFSITVHHMCQKFYDMMQGTFSFTLPYSIFQNNYTLTLATIWLTQPTIALCAHFVGLFSRNLNTNFLHLLKIKNTYRATQPSFLLEKNPDASLILHFNLIKMSSFQ